ncbi:hypothetical protein [Streptomyces sp. NPDC002540]
MLILSVVEAVLQLSLGLPLLVELLALARPSAVEEVDASGDVADVAVEGAGRDAMTELRHLLGLLAPSQSGEDEADLTPQPSLGRLSPLIRPDRVRRVARGGSDLREAALVGAPVAPHHRDAARPGLFGGAAAGPPGELGGQGDAAVDFLGPPAVDVQRWRDRQPAAYTVALPR